MYVKTIKNQGARIFLVGEAPGEYEDRVGLPFINDAGRTLDKILGAANLTRADCHIGNVARERPPGNKIDFFFQDKKMTIPKPILQGWIEELRKEIIELKPNIVVALGATALWALTGLRGISAFRGYVTESTLVQGQKVLPTYHPQKINYEWKLNFTAVMDMKKAVKESYSPEMPKDGRTLNAFPTKAEFIDYLKYLYYNHKEPIALDIETTNPGCHIDIIGIAESPNHALSMQIMSGNKARFSLGDEIDILSWIARVVRDKPVIMHNGLFDMTDLWYNNSILCNVQHDTLISGHICFPETPRSLAYLSSICLNVPAWKHTSQLTPTLYNAADAANTYGVHKVLYDTMTKRGILDTYNFEISQIPVASFLQLRGLDVDTERQATMVEEANKSLNNMYTEFENELGKKINLSSYKQMQSLLYVDLGLPIQYKRRKSKHETKTITTDAGALMKLERQSDNPILGKILRIKRLEKLLEFLEVNVSPEGKVHTSYNITGATMKRAGKKIVVDDEEAYKSFGRWSSSKSIILTYGSGNLQNIPDEARKIYKAPPGKVFLAGDYVQAEAVIVSYLISDEPMKQMFKLAYGTTKQYRDVHNLDIHKLTSARMNNIPVEQVTPKMRKVGKTIRHAVSYSAGPKIVADKLGCSMAEGKTALQRFFDSCPQLRMWHQRIQYELSQTRTLANLFGRKHKFLEFWGDELFRSAYSYIPQSTVGDLLNMAMVKFYDTYGSLVDIVLQLHDAFYVLSDENEVDANMSRMRECMLIPLRCNEEEFIIDVDFSVGKYWGEMEDYTGEEAYKLAAKLS